ncbi:VWFA and cache domain-containing protein CG16868 [Wyeomyia smithii]|uniref:VWFA and cache domain-containing protein CG16868 n=1 Tax=Wyeomyia smithii TaxID=174621 RepID=UPI002467EA7F|nr:VWFA and cache domain-containing protein CG16868 [Wyeomyia smithii]
MTSNLREQYYRGLLAIAAALFISSCRQAFATNHIFVNNIVPLISNLSGSEISFDNSSKVPFSSISTHNPVPPAADGPAALFPFAASQIQQQQLTGGSERDYSVLELSKLLEMKLKRIRNQELDVPVVQELYDTMEFTSVIRNDIDELDKIAKKLTAKFDQSVAVVDRMRAFIYDSISRQSAKYNTLISPCPYSNELINPWDDEPHFDLQSFIQNTKLMNSSSSSVSGSSASLLKQLSSESDFLDFSAFPTSPEDRPRIRINDQTVDDNNQLLQKRLQDQIFNMQSNFFSLKQLYFLSSFDQGSAFKCHYYPRDGRLKSLYLSSVRSKHFMILLNIGNSVSFDQLEVAKAIVKFIIYLLNENDRIAVIAVSQKLTTTESLNHCGNTPFVNATIDNKDRLVEFVDSLNKTSSAAIHVAAFRYAFKSLAEAYKEVNTELPIVFLYLGRAQVSPITAAARSVIRTIAEGQSRLPIPVIINSCLILLDEREISYEKQFIADFTTQNFSKYNITGSFHKLRPGKMVMISKHSFDAHRFVLALMEPFLTDRSFIEDRIRIHLPYHEGPTHDTLVTLSVPVATHGLMGVDLYLSDLAEDISYYKQDDGSYAFLIDLRGSTIMHPSFPRPLAVREHFFITNITLLERGLSAANVETLLSKPSGNLTILEPKSRQQKVYLWRRARFYIACIVRTLDDERNPNILLNGASSRYGQTQQLQYYHSRSNMDYSFISSNGFNSRNLLPDLIYHRIDIYAAHLQRPVPTSTSSNSLTKELGSTADVPRVCRLMKQLALADDSTLYLSASSFQSPYAHIRNNRDGSNDDDTLRTIQNIMAYLKDTTSLFANPGLLPEVRSDVLALLKVISNYRRKHGDSKLSKYIIRRYAATVNGVMQVYPGGLLDSDIEPSKRPWFVKAMQYPGKVVVTKPYLDAGGSGYIVSVSYTIFEGIADALHNTENDKPIVVVALDFSHGFFYKLLTESSSGVCNADNIKCFLMDDRGYLIAHPKLIEPAIGNNRRTLEHITHKESQVANDILNHKQLVTKKMCYNYVNRTVQRLYQFNMSLAEVVTNLMYGEKTKYQIALIPGTNVFIGVVNSTNDGGAFCPCSTVGNSCLNCNRMEQTECECPCECPLDYYENANETACLRDATANNGNRKPNPESIPLCSPLPEELISMHALNYESEFELKSCSNINCEDYTTQNECLGLVGCEWCQVDIDGENTLTTPFCTSQLTCFNGIFGSVTPYGDVISNNIMESVLPPAYSAIGPVAGAILALCLVVGFAMYCYRQNSDQSGASDQLYDDLVADPCNGLPLSRFDIEDHNPPDDCDISRTSAKQNLLLNGQNNANYVIFPNVTSPYQMSSNYRRPNAGSSDHGYSTMTHHEESEHLCLSNAEPVAPNASGKRMSMSDSASINTSVSSPYSNHQNFLALSSTKGQPYQPVNGADDLDQQQQKFIDPTQTVLPSPTSVSRTGIYGAGHHILVPVTVHRNMDVS